MRLRLMVQRVLGTGVLVLAGVLLAPSAGAARGWGKAHPLRVQAGVLTVDGMTVRTGLTLHTANLRYLFLYVPGEGTAVVAEQSFAGAREQKGALTGNALTVQANGRRLQLTSATRLRSTRSAFVRFDRGAGPALRVPAVAFGDAALVPAVWSVEDSPSNPGHYRAKVRSRLLRSGKLCRPSPRGRELCATIHEVVFKP